MHVCNIHWKSALLGKKTAMNVLLPETGEPPFPVFYLLHGRSDDYTAWLVNTRIESYAGRYPMIVVMPDGYLGFYTDIEGGPAYARHIGEELVDLVDRTFPTRAERAGRAIGGLSMGGYGALRVGLVHRNRFSSVHSHSGALMHGSRPAVDGREHIYPEVFGTDPQGTAHDLCRLAADAAKAGDAPAIRIDCGVDDFLIEDNRAYREALRKTGMPHTYEEHEGAHDWDYWDRHIPSALAFHARNLGIAASSH